MKPSGPGLLLVGSFLITVSISVLVICLFIFSISSWFSLGRLYTFLRICPFLPGCPFYFIFIFIFLKIYLVAPGLSCSRWTLVVARRLLSCGMRTSSRSMHVGSSSPTRDRTRAPCTGSTESQPLRHQGSPCPFY